MIDSVIFGVPVGHVSASVCAATDLCLPTDISEGREEKKGNMTPFDHLLTGLL